MPRIRRRLMPGSPLPKAVADPANREDQLRLVGILLDLLAQMTHVDVDRPGLAVIGAAAEALEQLAAGEDPAGGRGKHAQQLELDEGQLRLLPAHLDRPPGHVDRQLAGFDHLVVAVLARPRRRRTAEQGADTAPELADGERLRDVVVGAELEPEHLVQLVVAGRQHDDRHRALGAEPFANLQPVQSRQHQIQHDEVDVLLCEARECLLAVPCVDDCEAIALERIREQLLDGVLVVDEEDGGGVGHGRMLEARNAGDGRGVPYTGRAMAPPRRAPAPRGRPRRGSVERPVNARLVRGTWLLVALPLLLTAFSVARPQPLPAPTLPPTFEAGIADQLARELAQRYPDRSPGSSGGLGAADWVSEQFSLYGPRPRVERFRAHIPGRGTVELQNLIRVVQGASPRTLVFVSTDGGAFGALGAARFANSSPYRENALAVISLDAIAGPGRPRLLIAGDTARSPSAALVRTASLRVLEQTGSEPLRRPALRQLLDLGFPFTLGEQGPFVARGIPALTLTTLPDRASEGLEDAAFDVQRLAELGRASQNLIGSLDAGLELAQGTTSYINFGTRIVRGWALELVLLTALLPFLIGAIDLFAHCRRRRIPLSPAGRSLRSRLLFWGYAGVVIFVAAQLGAFPEGEARPLPPEPSLYQPSAVVVAILAVVL